MNDSQKILFHYEKRKNKLFFEKCKEKEIFDIESIQNFNPIYKFFFELNDTNYNSINLNHSKYVYDVNFNMEKNDLEYIIKENDKILNEDIFIKYAPILDPFKFLLGKYNEITNYILPSLQHLELSDVNIKLNDPNNSAYVDGLFYFLSNELLNKYNFIHGIEFYGSFVCIKNNFKINIEDDIEYLIKSDYFNKNKHLFLIKDDDIFETQKLKPIQIHHNENLNLSISSIDDIIFEDLFVETEKTIDNLEEVIIEQHISETENDIDNASINSSSSCSSRTSYTSKGEEEEEEENDSETDNESDSDFNSDNCSNTESNSDNNSENSSFHSNPIYATFPKFPVNMICIKKCEDTLDNLIINEIFKTDDEWFSSLFQIIMILITFQKCFSFTHNDLHTNNIMYNSTEEKYLYYFYNETYYKVPTYGRIFKIIDFGRSIYKINNKTICSDSFKKGEDASTQYNFEPFFNEKKPRIEPNYSFDLCRLACSIFDYIIDDINDIKHLKSCPPLIRLIVEWCMDDNNFNVLYKSNGEERYEEFKLYKMIARSVHNHTPQNQLSRKEFNKYKTMSKKISKDDKLKVINIDILPIF
jgi:hypothetical protein